MRIEKNNKFLDLFLRESASAPPEEEIDQILKSRDGVTLDTVQVLIDKGFVDKESVCRLWGKSIGFAYVDPIISVITPEALSTIPLEIARKAQVIALYSLDSTITAAMAHPEDEKLVRRLENITKTKVSPVFALPCEIEDAIEIHYSTEQSIADSIGQFEKKEGNLLERLSQEDLSTLSASESLINVVDALLYFAIKQGASDIHLEWAEADALVRLRIDGRLHEIMRFSRSVLPAIVSRLKILTKVVISENRFPQDGRFSLSVGTNKADFRVSFIPTIYGNNVVLRILPTTSNRQLLTLDKLFMSQDIVKPFRRLISSPNGILFVTGPTGSGKTTTLYSALAEINTPDKKISTIEDPVEVRMAGVSQSQVNSFIDLKFSILLRSILRQDPDVILVGEIRDFETAKIASEAALTGHLVLSTLHTNTAIQAIVRLIEIGIEPYVVAPSIIGVLAQRLAARICEFCRESFQPTQRMLNKHFYDSADVEEVTFYRGAGCPNCRQQGYRGRVAFHELVVVSEQMRSLISSNAGLQELKEAAQKTGYRSLRHDGLLKVLLGLTTIEEIEKHSSLEWSL